MPTAPSGALGVSQALLGPCFIKPTQSSPSGTLLRAGGTEVTAGLHCSRGALAGGWQARCE